MIRITAKVAGFRRAGIAHPAEPTDHPDDTFTAEQLAQLMAEPMLQVEEIVDPQAEQAAAGAQSDPAPADKPKSAKKGK